MAQAGYTPIQLYYSTTTTNVPTSGNLASGELAINITDGKLFYKDNGGSVQVIAWKTTPTTAGGTGLTSWTAGDLPYYATGTTLSKLGIGTNGQILTSTGTAPQWSTLSGVAVTTFSAGTTGFTPSSATSGAVTLAGTLATTNGGTGLTSFTANGVFYASSTSAIGQSANLTFDGTNFVLGSAGAIRTSNASGYFETQLSYYLNAGGGGGFQLKGLGSGVAGIKFMDAADSTELMRLTSTGLGIGTSSPLARLTVSDSSNPNSGTMTLGNNASFNGTLQYLIGPGELRISQVGSSSLGTTFYTNGAERMRLDSSGNLGLGVTPSAWQSTRKALQIGTTGSLVSSSSNTIVGDNWYVDSGGTDRYLATGLLATVYQQTSGVHRWFTAGSGTAGNTISFTQAMTLDASGNLGIGTTSPATKLHLYTPAAATTLTIDSGTSGTAIAYSLAGVAKYTAEYVSGSNFYSIGRSGVAYDFVLSGGNVGIGTTSPGGFYGKLTVAGGIRTLDDNSSKLELGRYSAGVPNSYIKLGTNSNSLRFTNAADLADLLELTNSGNLGLGVTPSAWSTGKAFEVGAAGTAIWSNSSVDSYYTQGAFFNAGWKYSHTGATGVSTYQQSQGTHRWSTAAGGTAGNAISFTQAMTLDAGGRLLLGTTSSIDNNLTLQIDTPASSSRFIGINRNGGYGLLIGYDLGGVDYANIRTVGAYPLTFGTNNTERLRITSVGNLSLGGTVDRGTTVGTNAIQIFNGTAPAGTLTNGVSLYSQSGDLRFMDAAGNAYQVGFRNVPQSGAAKTGSYTLATTDVGEFIQISTGGSITIPTSTFAAGDVVSLFNNTSGNITITCSAPTAYIAGANTVVTSVTLATRGVATVLFITATLCVITGNVS